MRHTYLFFNFIRISFGIHAVRLLKLWINLRKSCIKNRLRTEFLRKCIRSDIVPPHVNFLLRNNFNFLSAKYNNIYTRHRHIFIMKTLRLELRDTFNHIRNVISQIFKVTNSIYRYIPTIICDRFFNTQDSVFTPVSVRDF